MRLRLIAFGLVAAALLPSCSLLALQSIRARAARTEDVDFRQDLRPPPRSDIANTVERVLPAVVNVRVTEEIGGDPEAEGSGVIIDEAGIVLTNAHVVEPAFAVEGALFVEVALNERDTPVRGELIGAIQNRDLAIVKLPGDGYDAIDIGSSGNLRLGDDVIAIGYPLGLGGPTVTQGIISGEARQISTDTAAGQAVNLRDLLQTDAAINPGNSGGPLLDAAGRLVGINTAVAGFAENVGFAIAIDEALPIIEDILEQPDRAWLGVETDILNPQTAATLGLEPDSPGVLVVNVVPDTPAQEAGIEDGDVILSVDGTAVEDPLQLTDLITAFEPGAVVEIVVVSPSGESAIDVRLGTRPAHVPVE